MSRLRPFFLLTLLSVFAHFACQEEEPNRPPPLPPGNSGGGGFFPPEGGSAGESSGDGDSDGDTGGSPGSGGSGTGGTTGDGDGDGDGDPLETLVLSLARYTSDNFSDVTDYTETTVISQIESGGRELNSVEVEGGFGTLDLTDGDQGFWISAYPLGDDTLLPTVVSHGQVLDDVLIGLKRVALVPESVLAEILATTSSDLIPQGAQLVLRFVDEKLQPLAGVFVEYVEGGSLYTYASGNTWSEFRDNSDEAGLALYYSIPAQSFPGRLHTVDLRGAIEGSFRVQLIDGAVTIATFRKTPEN
jgi:hypothetical protein